MTETTQSNAGWDRTVFNPIPITELKACEKKKHPRRRAGASRLSEKKARKKSIDSTGEQFRGQAANFARLCQLEPRLADLFQEALEIYRATGPRFPTYEAWRQTWYRDFKPRLRRLVGDAACRDGVHPNLGTEEAYNIAYEAIYSALPS